MNVQTFQNALGQMQYADENLLLDALIRQSGLDTETRQDIVSKAAKLVERIRASSAPGLMEVFLAEYGLSTDEGIALMCLAEALLRVPDADTIDALIEDKIAPADWGRHLGQSSSSMVNAATWGLLLTGRVLEDDQPGVAGVLRGAIKRLGEPVIRTAVSRAMREMGRQFVLGETISKAMKRAETLQAKGYTYSYDMLGEAARTAEDAKDYFVAYSDALDAIAKHSHASVAENPGISVKLSALHPRYEEPQRDRVMNELVPLVLDLARKAKAANIGLNIDAEEADRLALSLDVIEATLADPSLAGWDGFGVVVQAYGQRAGLVIDHLYDLAVKYDRKIMVRLVKGAYWDAEIKRAQVEGIDGFPVFTQKAATDVSYIANARRLLTKADRIYPQFATHNAHTAAAILHLARDCNVGPTQYEFQRLHGMGETLHDLVKSDNDTRCRIYAPVGAHRDLLAYLVRRLLENGANSSFVNQIVDEDVPPTTVAACPIDALGQSIQLAKGPQLFGNARQNSAGFDFTHRPTLAPIDTAMAPFAAPHTWSADCGAAAPSTVINPADPADKVGTVREATPEDAKTALDRAKPWTTIPSGRASVLRHIADLYEQNFGEIFALLAREAGKALPDAIAELREAVDFLRFYAAEAEAQPDLKARGTWVCISPWNFPLAIFTGQIAAALAAGNAVVAKPAPQTPLIAQLAVSLMHEAGVPRTSLTLVPGGPAVGAALTGAANIDGVAFTGSTATAQIIRKSMADNARPGTPLIAETGGLNAMIVDSTALPEHAVRDILMSSFRSAGQRCSALRCLYVQEDIADNLIHMLKGAMDELSLGNPWHLSSDIGPVIDQAALDTIHAHVATAEAEGRLLHRLPIPETGLFVAPTLIKIDSIHDLQKEVFGPILHVATFKSDDLNKVIDDINATGYGLTFGLHTRIDDRVQTVVDRIEVGNVYVNRNQIGAVVGSQPFGGHGLSGTGPKAGGPNYLPRFAQPSKRPAQAAELTLPGPTGELNQLTVSPRSPIYCLGPDTSAQIAAVEALGGRAVAIDKDTVDLATVPDLSAVMWWGDVETARELDRALAGRTGPLVPLLTDLPDVAYVMHEKHLCVDTTAAGGNAALLAEVSKS